MDTSTFTKNFNRAVQEYKTEGKLEVQDVSDGYHTFRELYEHRAQLFIALCSTIHLHHPVFQVFRTKKNHDGSEYEGYFILGIQLTQKEQISYHLDISNWEQTAFATELERNINYDGHTSKEVLERLSEL